jgi:hypothetical protein
MKRFFCFFALVAVFFVPRQRVVQGQVPPPGSTPMGRCCDYSNCSLSCTPLGGGSFEIVPTNSVFACIESNFWWDAGKDCQGDDPKQWVQCGSTIYWSGAGCTGTSGSVPQNAVLCNAPPDALCGYDSM